MATVFFGEFGNKTHTLKEFNDIEKIILREAVKGASFAIQLAYKYSRTNFKDFHHILIHCFGNAKAETIKTVKEGIFKLNEICVDPKIFIKFIDAREQMHEKMTHLEKDLNDQYIYTFADVFIKKRIRLANQQELGAYVNIQTMKDLHCQYTGHVGSVMKIYIGEAFFCAATDDQQRQRIICHELTHKALSTVDYSFFEEKTTKKLDNTQERNIKVELIYGEESVENIAKASPENAIRIADCWSMFIAYIEYITHKFM